MLRPNRSNIWSHRCRDSDYTSSLRCHNNFLYRIILSWVALTRYFLSQVMSIRVSEAWSPQRWREVFQENGVLALWLRTPSESDISGVYKRLRPRGTALPAQIIPQKKEPFLAQCRVLTDHLKKKIPRHFVIHSNTNIRQVGTVRTNRDSRMRIVVGEVTNNSQTYTIVSIDAPPDRMYQPNFYEDLESLLIHTYRGHTRKEFQLCIIRSLQECKLEPTQPEPVQTKNNSQTFYKT